MAELLKAPTRWWNNVQTTGPNVETHPRATLDAQAARYMTARQSVMQLDMAIQDNTNKFKSVLAEIEKHYHEQVDNIEAQYTARSTDLDGKYRAAHEQFMREQRAFAEMLKHVDCKAEFINHFPAPKPLPPPDERPES